MLDLICKMLSADVTYTTYVLLLMPIVMRMIQASDFGSNNIHFFINNNPLLNHQ
jgi:hypothetical protein